MERDKDNRQKIIDKIIHIMVQKLKVNQNLLIVENYDKPLTGTVFNISGLMMTYLFFEIEKSFGIRIDTAKILNYEFNTINDITELIMVGIYD